MSTPVTVGQLTGSAQSGHCCPRSVTLPATGMTLAHASQIAHLLGGRLPTSSEWEWMAGAGIRLYPWGDHEPDRGGSWANIRGVGPDTITPVGTFPSGATPEGVLDVAGNVWEWTSTPAGIGYVVRGGSYRAVALYAQCTFANEVPATLSSPGIGVRVVREP
ncbi:SUMF1/EgtB/PvdO family nonheme iron enzyme [Actinoplanes sp. NPDC051411]|uniref:formylglycine-generating enzyme family protein n=1 Tax=Actinoplanes sp. NPDC051411 TaxID=3155522 RepID=UPI0034469F2D